MYRYTAYGLTIESELPLHGFPQAAGSGDPAAVCIRLGHVDAAAEEEGLVVGYADGLFKFAAERGHTITIEPFPGAEPGFTNAVLTGELMALVLRQRGFLALHASCVSKSGAAVAFLGNAGWGKSTLATSFLDRGYRLVCDDVLVLDVRSEPVMAIPASPQMRLTEEVGELYGGKFATATRAHERTTKRSLLRSDAFQASPVRLAKLYVLEPNYKSEAAIRPISPTEATLELLQHTRALRLTAGTSAMSEHLRQCAKLVREVPIARLERVRALGELGVLGDMIETDALTPVSNDIA